MSLNGEWFFHYAGFELGLGDSLSITFDNVLLYSAALEDESLWDEGQVWAQKWFAPNSGGSTSVTPEPATLLLLGSGMMGFAAIRRKFKKR